jgi:hypothetical protein
MGSDDTSPTTSAPGSRCDCKIGTAIERFGLTELNDDLIDAWTGTEKGASLRDLEREINRRVLSAALRAAAVDPPEGSVEATYRVLTEDDSGGGRVAIRNRLDRQGVDIDAVEDAFVSHQTVHNHLRGCLDVSHDSESPTPEERLDTGRQTVTALRSRLEAVTETVVDQLRRADVLSLPPFDVYVDVNVACRECGRYHSIEELLSTRGCACRGDD